jgi:hypothetical protein
MKKLILIALSLGVFSSITYGQTKNEPWEQEACTELYNSITLFVGLADKEWKKENAERASFFASVAADYSIIYQTVCRVKKII